MPRLLSLSASPSFPEHFISLRNYLFVSVDHFSLWLHRGCMCVACVELCVRVVNHVGIEHSCGLFRQRTGVEKNLCGCDHALAACTWHFVCVMSVQDPFPCPLAFSEWETQKMPSLCSFCLGQPTKNINSCKLFKK